MIEVIWHARGGQGAFTAARCLGAAAALSAGAHALAFPTFGPERRGAPMRAYTKISSAPIGDRSASRQGQIVVYLDETLFVDGWEDELAEGGIVLLNTTNAPDDPRIIALDADGISTEVLGRPIPNTAFLGAIAALTDVVTLEDIHAGIRATMPERLQEKNIRIADAAYQAVMADPGVDAQKDICASTKVMSQDECGCDICASTEVMSQDECGCANVSLRTPPETTRQNVTHTPYLRESFTPPAGFARSTCFTAGNLVSENAGWRSEFPVIDDDRCTRCLSCYQFCPDGTIFKVRNAEGELTRLAIDYAFCKGCGVCAQVCPVDCIAMIPEGAEEEAA